MSRLEPRKRLISSLAVVFVVAHLSYYATKNQHWPILGFPMYSYIHEHVVTCPGVYGVPEDPKQPEFRLTSNYLRIPVPTVKQAFKKMLRYPERNSDYASFAASCHATDRDAERACVSAHLISSGLEYIYGRYDGERDEASEPRLRGVKLYNIEFRFVNGDFVAKPLELLGEWDRRP